MGHECPSSHGGSPSITKSEHSHSSLPSKSHHHLSRATLSDTQLPPQPLDALGKNYHLHLAEQETEIS